MYHTLPAILSFVLFIELSASKMSLESPSISISASNALNITKQCGTTQIHHLMHDNIEREVILYIPSILCNETAFAEKLNRSNISFDPLQNQTVLPMMINLHWYSGSAQRAISTWQSLAEELTFILVAPNGIEHSWNADQCCGYAADNKLNDTAFIQSVIHKVQQSFSETFPFLTLYRSTGDNREDGYLWFTGFSNGGYMADKLVSY